MIGPLDAGGDDGVALYHDRLQAVCERYDTVVLLGDSMGASAALLFAPLASAVLAFCPQVTSRQARDRGPLEPSILALKLPY